jgi:hypothetical protein
LTQILLRYFSFRSLRAFFRLLALRLAVAGRVGDDLVDHICQCASHLVQCHGLDVLDDFMRDPVALGLVLLYFRTPVVSTHSISQVPSAQWKRKLTISSLCWAASAQVDRARGARGPGPSPSTGLTTKDVE